MKKFNFKKTNATCKHASKKVYRRSNIKNINVKVDANTKSIDTLKDDVKNLTEASSTLADRFNKHEKISNDVLCAVGASASVYVTLKLVEVIVVNRKNKKLLKNVNDLNNQINHLYERLDDLDPDKIDNAAEEKKDAEK